MSKLFARAKVKKINADNDFRNLSLDDAFLDDCCYNLQQCIEACLKYIVELNGEEYVENHDVRAQLNKLSALGVNLSCTDKIRSIASTLNSWEVESRYNDNFTALLEDITDAKEIADELLEYCDSLVQEDMGDETAAEESNAQS